MIKNFLYDSHERKHLVDLSISNDYLIFDNIFSSYKVNEKKRFFYYFKNKFFLNFFFKLSNKDVLQYKNLMYMYTFNYYISLNKNYLFQLYYYN